MRENQDSWTKLGKGKPSNLHGVPSVQLCSLSWFCLTRSLSALLQPESACSETKNNGAISLARPGCQSLQADMLSDSSPLLPPPTFLPDADIMDLFSSCEMTCYITGASQRQISPLSDGRGWGYVKRVKTRMADFTNEFWQEILKNSPVLRASHGRLFKLQCRRSTMAVF